MNANETTQEGTITIDIRFAPELKWRIQTVALFLRLVAGLMGWAMAVDFDEDPADEETGDE